MTLWTVCSLSGIYLKICPRQQNSCRLEYKKTSRSLSSHKTCSRYSHRLRGRKWLNYSSYYLFFFFFFCAGGLNVLQRIYSCSSEPTLVANCSAAEPPWMIDGCCDGWMSGCLSRGRELSDARSRWRNVNVSWCRSDPSCRLTDQCLHALNRNARKTLYSVTDPIFLTRLQCRPSREPRSLTRGHCIHRRSFPESQRGKKLCCLGRYQPELPGEGRDHRRRRLFSRVHLQ